MHIVPGEIIISAYGLVYRVYWDLEKELAMNITQQQQQKKPLKPSLVRFDILLSKELSILEER